MRITIDLETDNEAFGHGMYEETVELILQTLASMVAYGEDVGHLLDHDNKTVCQFAVIGR